MSLSFRVRTCRLLSRRASGFTRRTRRLIEYQQLLRPKDMVPQVLPLVHFSKLITAAVSSEEPASLKSQDEAQAKNNGEEGIDESTSDSNHRSSHSESSLPPNVVLFNRTLNELPGISDKTLWGLLRQRTSSPTTKTDLKLADDSWTRKLQRMSTTFLRPQKEIARESLSILNNQKCKILSGMSSAGRKEDADKSSGSLRCKNLWCRTNLISQQKPATRHKSRAHEHPNLRSSVSRESGSSWRPLTPA